MTRFNFSLLLFCLLVAVLVLPGLAMAQTTSAPTPEPTVVLNWDVVVNNGDIVPGDLKNRKFNSYNQPSINVSNLVVFRARSKAGKNSDGTTGEPAHGVYTRDMGTLGSILPLFDRTTFVPQPNNLGTMFVEPPSFPRIDIFSNTVASRGNHQPAWEYMLPDGTESRAGTTGIYTNPFGSLISGDNNLGGAPGLADFGHFAEPVNGVKFDVFPGAPAVTNGSTIVFKGNFTVGVLSKTGVYYRTLTNTPLQTIGGNSLSPAGGTNKPVLIANSDTLIPGAKTNFGSTAPPSAAAGKVVFAGFDNEDAPTIGGIYLADLVPNQKLKPAVVRIGGAVPGESGAKFNKIGEGLSFDGRFIAFWGAWGSETKTLVLQCPAEGNKDRQAFCLETYPNGFSVQVPVHQGIFVYDTNSGNAYAVAKTPEYSDFVYWNFSGLVPGTGESDETGEPARWRSASFVAVSGLVDGSLTDPKYHVAFKARTGDVINGAYANPTDGIYLKNSGTPDKQVTVVVAKTGMDGTLFDAEATYIPLDEAGIPIPPGEPVPLPVTEMGIERDGFRGNSLAVNISMGTEEAGFAGIYLTHVPVF